MASGIENRTRTEAAEAASPGERAPRARRVWFPFAWVGGLAAVCAYFWIRDVDPGITNSVINMAVAFGVVGVGLWTLRSTRLPRRARWALGLGPSALVAGYFLQVLPFEMVNNGDAGWAGWRWRWSEPDRTLAKLEAPQSKPIVWQDTPQDYPRFLGNGYWAEVEGVTLDPDWKAHPPRELWRRKIGAGWSGYAAVGDYAITQEQRGPEELVVCYDARTGEPAWTHADEVRWDPRGAGALGDIGPRATPTIFQGKVFVQGATGILNCLDARTGKVLWRHDTLVEHHADNVLWGKSTSPLVVDDKVIASVGAKDASLVAYNIESGKEVWAAGSYRSSYASPVLTELARERQILSVDEGFLTSHRPEDGALLWEHSWPSGSDTSAAASQPVPVGDDRVLLSMGYGMGAELIEVKRNESVAWSTATLWKSPALLKTKMGNVLVRDGYAYGLDEAFLQCVDLAAGRSMWKKRRSPTFGHGQIVLVGDDILILSESGELILVEANPKKYVELSSFPVLEGVTWNNPTLVGSRLLVRNSEEAACFELPVRGAENN